MSTNNDRDINVTGRKIRYEPWAVDELNKYREPTKKEKDDI